MSRDRDSPEGWADNEKLAGIIEDLTSVDDWELRYGYLIELGRQLPSFDESEKTDANLVRGCLSQVWMVLDVRDGIVSLRGTSDALIVRGLIAVVLQIYDGRTLDQSLLADPAAIFDRLGLGRHLSIGRRNGLESMIATVKARLDRASRRSE